MSRVDDDAALVVRTLAGDQTAYATLVDFYHGEVYHLCLRSLRLKEDAEDLTQEAFIRAFRALESFDTTRPFGAWMYSITARLCIDFHRRKRIKPVSLTRAEEGSADEEHDWDLPDPGVGPEEQFAQLEISGQLGELIERLPPDYRIAILLRHAHDFSYEEISQTLETPLGTIKARIHRARAQLRAWLAGTELAPGELDPDPGEGRKELEKKPKSMHPNRPNPRRKVR
jgi:RNA polymerase sigma-70 factor (ECF subfamily)